MISKFPWRYEADERGGEIVGWDIFDADNEPVIFHEGLLADQEDDARLISCVGEMVAVLRESEKQLRLMGANGHAEACASVLMMAGISHGG